jgi:hypothetical protein
LQANNSYAEEKWNRLWSKLTEAIHNKDMDAATTSKGEVEDAQREEARKREEAGKKHVPRFFELKEGLWHVKMKFVSLSFRSIQTIF